MESIQREISQMNTADFLNSLAVELGNYLEVCGRGVPIGSGGESLPEFQFARRLF